MVYIDISDVPIQWMIQMLEYSVNVAENWYTHEKCLNIQNIILSREKIYETYLKQNVTEKVLERILRIQNECNLDLAICNWQNYFCN